MAQRKWLTKLFAGIPFAVFSARASRVCHSGQDTHLVSKRWLCPKLPSNTANKQVVHSAQVLYSHVTEIKELATPLFVPGTEEKDTGWADGTREDCSLSYCGRTGGEVSHSGGMRLL